MLKNELDKWNAYLEAAEVPPDRELRRERKAISTAWTDAAFSAVPAEALARYYSFHYKSVSDLRQRLPADAGALGGELAKLAAFLEVHFFDFLNTAAAADSERLQLRLSVAQLGCFLRLFHEAGGFPADSIVSVIRFCAANFRTKRQERISSGSLSKEYYSITQVTAATCRDLLDQLIKQIDKQFFPK